jgi:hypothetical protein
MPGPIDGHDRLEQPAKSAESLYVQIGYAGKHFMRQRRRRNSDSDSNNGMNTIHGGCQDQWQQIDRGRDSSTDMHVGGGKERSEVYA